MRGALAAQRNGDARYALDLLATAAYHCQEEGHNTVTEDDLRRAQRLPEASLIRRSGPFVTPQKVLLECVYSKEEEQSPTEVCQEFNTIVRFDGREQASYRTLSELIAELDCKGLLRWNEKGGVRAEGLTYIPLLQDLLSEKCC